MIWYRNSSDEQVNNVGDYDIAEVLEHLMHTLHLYGVPGAVTGSQTALQWDPEYHRDWQTSELYLAMKEAVDNGVFSLKDYGDENLDIPTPIKLRPRNTSTCLILVCGNLDRNSGKTEPWHPSGTTIREHPPAFSNTTLGHALFNALRQTRALQTQPILPAIHLSGQRREAPATKPTEAEISLQASAAEAEQIPFSADQNAIPDGHGDAMTRSPISKAPRNLNPLSTSAIRITPSSLEHRAWSPPPWVKHRNSNWLGERHPPSGFSRSWGRCNGPLRDPAKHRPCHEPPPDWVRNTPYPSGPTKDATP